MTPAREYVAGDATAHKIKCDCPHLLCMRVAHSNWSGVVGMCVCITNKKDLTLLDVSFY